MAKINKPTVPTMPSKPTEPLSPLEYIWQLKYRPIKGCYFKVSVGLSGSYDNYEAELTRADLNIDDIKAICLALEEVKNLNIEINNLYVDLPTNSLRYEEKVLNPCYNSQYKNYETKMVTYRQKLNSYNEKLTKYNEEMVIYNEAKLSFDYESAKRTLKTLEEKLKARL